jgi:hypothetical protein
MIAGCVSGGCVALAWTVGFIIYFVKIRQRKRQAIAAGFTSRKDFVVTEPLPNPTTFIIPPDPAVAGICADSQIKERLDVQERGKAVTEKTHSSKREHIPPSHTTDSTPPFNSMLEAPSSIEDSAASFLSIRDSDTHFPSFDDP